LKKIEEKDKIIRLLEVELLKSKLTSRMYTTKVREELKWTGEETNFGETVNHFCRNWIFPKFKFLIFDDSVKILWAIRQYVESRIGNRKYLQFAMGGHNKSATLCHRRRAVAAVAAA
jgi:hypothetical protein